MFILGVIGVWVSNNYDRKKGDFMSIYIMWQFAHCASGGVTNVLLPVFINLLVFVFANMFPISRKPLEIDNNDLRVKEESV